MNEQQETVNDQQEYVRLLTAEDIAAMLQLKVSVSFLNDSVRNDPSAPVIMGRGMIACNTPALQSWWDGKNHHHTGG